MPDPPTHPAPHRHPTGGGPGTLLPSSGATTFSTANDPNSESKSASSAGDL